MVSTMKWLGETLTKAANCNCIAASKNITKGNETKQLIGRFPNDHRCSAFYKEECIDQDLPLQSVPLLEPYDRLLLAPPWSLSGHTNI